MPHRVCPVFVWRDVRLYPRVSLAGRSGVAPVLEHKPATARQPAGCIDGGITADQDAPAGLPPLVAPVGVTGLVSPTGGLAHAGAATSRSLPTAGC